MPVEVIPESFRIMSKGEFGNIGEKELAKFMKKMNKNRNSLNT
jgi:hypothetical protein